MALIVQKYGGTSVGDVDRIKNVAQRIHKTRSEGHGLIVVVSARSGVTNELIAKAKAISDRPDTREMDMLLAIGEQETIALTAMALHAIGVPAVSYTGAQAGILTDQVFTKAKIKQIVPKGIMQDLKAGKVVYDGPASGLKTEQLIDIYGPEFEDDDDLEADLEEDDELADPDVIVEVEDEEEDEEPVVPATRARPAGEEEDEDEDPDPDDVEADLDTILKDRIASGADDDEDEEEEVPVDRNDPEATEGVVSKREGEFTCTGCFMIVHPRQFGRKGRLTCPTGDEDCPSISIVAAQLP